MRAVHVAILHIVEGQTGAAVAVLAYPQAREPAHALQPEEAAQLQARPGEVDRVWRW